MSFRYTLIATLTTICCGTAGAHSPAKFLEVLEGKASSVIQHGVEVKTVLDPKRAEVALRGPELFARGVLAMGRSGRPPEAYLGWYKIESSDTESLHTVSILDPFRGGDNVKLSLSGAEYLLCPTQVITSGPPAAIPHGLDYYEAFRVADANPLRAKVTVGNEERVVGKPVFVCIAAKHWHHEETTDASHPDQCFVVYEINEMGIEEKISTMDQFGLNQFTATSSKWLCVTGKLLNSTASDN